MRKFTQEEIEDFYLKKGYKVLTEYTGIHDKLDVEEISTGYRFVSTFHHFREGEIAEPFGYRNEKFQKYNIELFLSRKYPDIKFISAQKTHTKGKTRNKITLKCICGKTFIKEWCHVYNDKRLLCPKCSLKAQRKDSREKLDNNAIKKIESFGYRFEEYPKHIFGNKLVDVINKDGYRVKVTATALEKKRKDIVFSEYTNRDNLIYNLNVYFDKKDMDCKAIEITDKISDSGKVLIKYQCECGRYFYSSIGGAKQKKGRCNYCNQVYSKNEYLVQNLLEINNIRYIQEYKFNACKDKSPLPFDFHLTDYDCLIEVDGEQHFRPCKFSNNISKEDVMKRFNNQKRRDEIKNKFCKEHHIPLLRIPYWEFENDNYKQIILNFIETVKA